MAFFAGGNAFAATATVNLSTLISGADKVAAARVGNLNSLIVRVNATQKITDAQKSSLVAAMQQEITAINNLKIKIDADKDVASVQKDIKNLNGSSSYPLVVRKTFVIASADRALTVAGSMELVGAKLQERISALPSGTDKTSLQKLYNDFISLIRDAKTQANAAISQVSALQADNGDTAKKQANTTALKAARDKVKLAVKDFVAARKTVASIAKTIKTLAPKAAGSTTTTTTKPATTTTQPAK